MNFLGLFLLSGSLLINTNPIDLPDDATIIEDNSNESFLTKRLWFNITNKDFLKTESTILLDYKENEFKNSFATTGFETIKNHNGGIYYYIDLPLNINGFRIRSVNSDNQTITKTKWKFNLSPSSLHEVFNGSDLIRQRRADVYPPDAFVISTFLSAYYAKSNSYENGYSAYQSIKTNWLNYYAGNVRGTLDKTFMYDYETIDFNNDDNRKNVLISATEKIELLKNGYDNNPKKTERTNHKIKIIGLLLFSFTLLVAIPIAFFVSPNKACLKAKKERQISGK